MMDQPNVVASLSAPLTDLASQLHVVGSSLASTTTTEADPITALPHILKGIDNLQQTLEQCDTRLQQALHSLDQRTALLRVDGDILAGQFPRMSCSLSAWHHAHPVAPTRPSSVSATPSNRAQSAPTASLLSTPMQGPRGAPPSPTHGPVPQCTPPLNATDSLPASPTLRPALPQHSTSSCLEGGACSAGVKAYLSQFADWAPSATVEGRRRPDAPPFLLDGDDEEGTAEGEPLPTRPNLRRTVDAMLLRELQYDGITLTAEMERQLSGEGAAQDFQDGRKPHAGRVGDGSPVRVSFAIERGEGTDPASLYQDLRHGVFTPTYTPNVAASTVEGGVVRCHLQAHFPRLVTWLERVAAEDGSALPLEDGHSNAFERDETGAPVSSCIELSHSTTPTAGDGPGSPLQPGSTDSRPHGPSWSGHNATRLDSVEEYAEEAMSLPPVRPDAREVSETATATSPFMSPAEVEEGGHSILDYSFSNFQTYVEDPGSVPRGEVSQEPENTTPIGVSVGDTEATRRALPYRLRVHCNAVRRVVRSHATTLLADLAVLTLLQELTSIVGCRCHAAGADEDALLSSMKAATRLFHAFHHDPWLVDLLSQRTPAVSGMKADGNEETSWQSDISRLSSPQRLLCYEHIITALGYVPLVPALQRHSPTDTAPSLNCLHFLDTVAPFLTLWGCRPTELIVYRSRPPPSHCGSRLPFSATVAPQVWLESVCTSLLHQVYHLNRLVYLLHRMEDTDVAAVGETLGEWHDRMDNLRRTAGIDAARPEYPENGLARWVLPFSQCILEDLAVWEASGLLKASSLSMSARRSCPSAMTAEPLAPVGVESLELPSAEGTRDETRDGTAPSEPVNIHAPLVRQLSRDSNARERRRAEPAGLWTRFDLFSRNRNLAGLLTPPPPTGVSISSGVQVMSTNAMMLELPHASEILISRDARLRRSNHTDFFQPPSRSSASPAADLPYPEGPPPGYYAAGPCLCSSPTSRELVRWQFSFRATMCYCLVSRHRCIDPLVSGALLIEPWRQPADETLPQAISQLRHPDAQEQITAAAVRRVDMARLLATLPSPSDAPVADLTHISFAALGDGEGNDLAVTSQSLSSVARPVSVQLLTRNLSDPLCSTHSARLNPPDLLSCGHVLSHTELQRLSRMQQRGLHARQRHAIGSPPPPLSVRCPYCARETSLLGVLTLSYIY